MFVYLSAVMTSEKLIFYLPLLFLTDFDFIIYKKIFPYVISENTAMESGNSIKRLLSTNVSTGIKQRIMHSYLLDGVLNIIY